MGVQFGSFDSICQTAALVICPLLGSDQGIEPTCYSRNVDIAGTLIFQPCEFFTQSGAPLVLSKRSFVLTGLPVSFSSHALATCFVHVVAILMTGIMIYHIRSKYTAVGKSDPFTVNQRIVRCRPLLLLVRARSQGDCHVLLSLCDHRTHRVLS
jgi:Chitin synthase export chaperone